MDGGQIADALPAIAIATTSLLDSQTPVAGCPQSIRDVHFPQQFLYFLPLPQGQGSLRPTFGPVRTGLALARSSTACAASLTMSLALGLSPCFGDSPSVGLGSCLVSRGALRRKFSNAIRLDALRKTLWQISDFTLTISSSKILNASALYSSSGSRWPWARRPMLWRRLSIS